jgi:hypothetical protein
MAERALDTTPHDNVGVGRDSHFTPATTNVPAVYERLRPWLPRLVVAGAIAFLWQSAPVWVTAIACGVLLLQFMPARSVPVQ